MCIEATKSSHVIMMVGF